MKSKPSKAKGAAKPGSRAAGLLAVIDEARILQLSNDLSEEIASGTTKEWRAVAYYFRHQVDSLQNSLDSIRCSVAAWVTASKIHAAASLAADGSVTSDALIVAFVQGAKWWEYQQTGWTMWPSDQDQAEGRAEEMARCGILGKSPNT